MHAPSLSVSLSSFEGREGGSSECGWTEVSKDGKKDGSFEGRKEGNSEGKKKEALKMEERKLCEG